MKIIQSHFTVENVIKNNILVKLLQVRGLFLFKMTDANYNALMSHVRIKCPVGVAIFKS